MSYRAHIYLCIQEAERSGFYEYAKALRKLADQWEGGR